jgi:hypothetical protein
MPVGGIFDTCEHPFQASMGTKALSTPTIYNVAMTTGGTEYSQVLPKGAKKVLIQLRGLTASFILYYATGASTYITIAPGCSKVLEGVWLDSITLFFKSATSTQVAEIEVWN